MEQLFMALCKSNLGWLYSKFQLINIDHLNINKYRSIPKQYLYYGKV
jgi:hypothetical protein